MEHSLEMAPEVSHGHVVPHITLKGQGHVTDILGCKYLENRYEREAWFRKTTNTLLNDFTKSACEVPGVPGWGS